MNTYTLLGMSQQIFEGHPNTENITLTHANGYTTNQYTLQNIT